MLDLAYVARLDFLAHLRELSKKRTTESDEGFVPVDAPTPSDNVDVIPSDHSPSITSHHSREPP